MKTCLKNLKSAEGHIYYWDSTEVAEIMPLNVCIW